jgi:hypothetical protein
VLPVVGTVGTVAAELGGPVVGTPVLPLVCCGLVGAVEEALVGVSAVDVGCAWEVSGADVVAAVGSGAVALRGAGAWLPLPVPVPVPVPVVTVPVVAGRTFRYSVPISRKSRARTTVDVRARPRRAGIRDGCHRDRAGAALTVGVTAGCFWVGSLTGPLPVPGRPRR